MNKQEDFQNRALANLLTALGVAADFEQRAGRRRCAEVDMPMTATFEGAFGAESFDSSILV